MTVYDRIPLKISPSLLESFRQAQVGTYADSLRYFHEAILKPYESSAPARRGTAFHKIVEDYPGRNAVSEDKLLKIDGQGEATVIVEESDITETWTFEPNVTEIALKIRDRHPGMIAEMWGGMNFRDINGHDVMMNLRMDGVWLNELVETKTTSKAPTWKKYYDSIQWRCYLRALKDLRGVRYHIVKMPRLRADYDRRTTKAEYFTYWFERQADNDEVIERTLSEMIGYVESQPDLYRKLHDNAVQALERDPSRLEG